MMINCAFDSGNIIEIESADSGEIKLEIRKDRRSKFLQWFHFRVDGVKQRQLTYSLSNSTATTFPRGWNGYRVFVSEDRQKWFRIPTTNDQQLSWSYKARRDSVYFAYYVPYSYERQLDLSARVLKDERFSQRCLGRTVEKRPMDLLQIGNPEGKKLWFVARQHPGESMASWYVEGLLEALLQRENFAALLENACLFIVPNMNPDGSVAGSLRANVAGVDLNREWQKPSLKKSPEVYCVKAEMERVGVDFFQDIHGDETIPYNFIACCEGIPSYSGKQRELEERFRKEWEAINPDFQSEHGYKRDEPGKANMKISCHAIGERFGCLSMTLEMPFKDNARRKRRQHNPIRSIKKLASTCLQVVEGMVDAL